MKKSHKRLFWSAIALILLVSAGRVLSWPTQPDGRDMNQVVISEIVANNNTGIQDEDGDYVDWIEIHNRSARDINLLGWSLSDDPDRPDKWVFPELTLPADGYMVVFASGKDQRDITDSDTPLHTNFKLDGAGGTLTLYNPTSRRYLDANPVVYPSQFPDVSFGPCEVDRGGCYFETPTPGAANATPRTDLVGVWRVEASLTFSHERGFYDESFDLALTTNLANASIRYTLDGSEATGEAGRVYERAIPIGSTTIVRATVSTPDGEVLPTVTHSYIFVDDVLAQPAQPAGYPPTWGFYHVDFQEHPFGSPVQADYEMDTEITEHPEYGDMLTDSLRSLPTLSLVTDIKNLDIYFDDPKMHGPDAERPVSAELIYSDDSQPDFQIDAGLRTQGGKGRWEQVPKHSLRLFFKQKYGINKLEYPIFSDSAVNNFETLILRAGTDRSFAGIPPEELMETTYVRDEWARRSQIEMSGVGSHGMFVHLYLNGMYWGLYNLVERPDASFTSSYYGGDVDSWYAANHGGSISGRIDRFAVLVDLAEAGGLADPGKYATILEFIDPAQFSDYVLLNWYAGTNEWPEINWYAGVQYPAGRNLFFVWDAEISWRDGAEIRLGGEPEAGAPFPNVVKLVFEALAENDDFRLAFADRLYKHLFNDGALAEENAKARWLDVNAEVEDAIVAESARWGDVRFDSPITPENWSRARDNVLGQMEGNVEKLVDLARTAGYYPAIDPPQWSQHGGTFEGELQLIMSAPAGDIYFTRDGSDPREPGSGAVSENAALYSEPLHLTSQTTIKARVKQGDLWSALREAKFTEASQQARLCVTEIMYNPSGGSDYEFLEMTNIGDAEMDLSYAQFEGIDFHFPNDSIIHPGESLVLIRDYYAYRELYPKAPFDGFFRGALANEGETILLKDVRGNLLLSVSYDDENGWPLSADGLGDSLVRVHCLGAPDDSGSWDVSINIYGDPGEFIPLR